MHNSSHIIHTDETLAINSLTENQNENVIKKDLPLHCLGTVCWEVAASFAAKRKREQENVKKQEKNEERKMKRTLK